MPHVNEPKSDAEGRVKYDTQFFMQASKNRPTAIAEAPPERKMNKDEEAEEDEEGRLFSSSCGGYSIGEMAATNAVRSDSFTWRHELL